MKKIVIVVISIVILIIVSIGLLVPKIKLKGNSVVKIEYNSKYKDTGIKATFLFKDITNKIKIENNVNTKKIGEYNVKYTYKLGILNITKIRKVIVVDTKKPKITLEGEVNVFACPNRKFEEIGFTAYDDYDGDITDKVEINEQDNSIIYIIKDSSGNTTKASRTIERIDNENPVIILKGNQTTYVTLYNKYTDPGYTASDNCDKDLTNKVKVEGEVDTSKEGSYQIKYSVVDSNNNKVEVIRKVIVTKEIIRRSANMSCGEPGVIYLTFDDGPNNSTTTEILNILKKYNVKATFFVTNTNGGSDSQIKREYDEGHKVALHTSTHDYSKVYASDEAYFKDLNDISTRVERITGEKSTLMRFPGGSSNTVSRHYSTNIMSRLVNEVEEKGYTYFDWNVDSRDAERKGSEDIYNYTIGGLSKIRGNVVLMHDIHATTKNALERIIKTAIDRGYTFKTLDSSVKCWHRVNN